MKYFAGIDPGSSGSMTVLDEVGKLIGCVRFAKATDKEIFEFMSEVSMGGQIFCIKEKVWAMPSTDGEGRKMGASTSFTFGENNGFIRGLLVGCQIAYEEFTPQTWQKYFSMKKDKGEAQTDYKRRLKQKAEELFPSIKITNDMADSILIAEYCRRKHLTL